MSRAIVAVLAALALGGIGLTAFAQTPTPRPPDPRIRVYPYDPDRVTPLAATFGYQMMIQFGEAERIQNVAIGEGSTWQVTPNHAANLLFVKPLEHAARTNLTVVTDRRSYLFDLSAEPPKSAGGVTFVVRFIYAPDPIVVTVDPPPPPEPPERRNTRYSYTGSRQLLPSVVFDDGRFTYFKWPDGASIPALFLLAPDGSESLTNYSFHDGYQVVEQTAPRFKLRSGKQITTVINEGWSEPAPGAEAPRPHDAKTAREAKSAQGAS
jgi:type IV secretion system protein VirB9